MAPKTQILLSEKNIYVSWGILIGIVVITAVAVKIMFQLEELTPLLPFIQQLDKRVSLIEYQLKINSVIQK